MNNHNFDSFGYFPSLRTRGAELKGLLELRPESKDKIFPVITLGKWRNMEGVEPSMDKINECLGERPFILDISNEFQHQNAEARRLKHPTNNFENWVKFVESNEKIVPVVQFSADAKTREIVKQANNLEKIGRQPVFKITDFKNDIQKTLSSLYSLENPENSLIVIDASYIRELSSKAIKPGTLENILKALNMLIDEFPEVTRVLSGTSFPRSVTPFLDEGVETSGKIDMLENILYEEIGSDIIKYSDHASIHSVVYDDTGGMFLPRIDVPDDGFWYFERRPKTDSSGYISAAKALLERHSYLKDSPTWGAELIRNTADERNKEDKKTPTIKAPVTAIAVRANLHMEYQIKNISTENLSEDDGWSLL